MIRRLDAGVVSPQRSQALYHGLAQAMTAATPDTVVFCTPAAPYVCVGYHQRADDVLDLALCRRRGWPVLRRKIGGGAVYLDGGQLGEAIVVVGNVLFDFPDRRMARAWRAPSPPFRRLAHEGLRRHLTTLSRCLPEPVSLEAVREAIAAAYAETLGAPLVPGTVSAAEARAVARAEAELGSEAFVRDGDGARGAGLKIARGVFVYEGRDAASGVCVSVRTRDGRIDALAVRGAGARAARRLLGREVGGAAGPNPADVIARALGAARTGGRPCVTAS